MLEAVRKLAPADGVEAFDCGQTALNQFLQRHALNSQRANSAQTYVCCDDTQVAAFYSLTVGSVAHADAPQRLVQGLARHPVPVMLLARLAVNQQHQGRGLGAAMLKDALRRTAAAADIAGIRALLVHAKDESAQQWYQSFDFKPSPTDRYHLHLMLKDLKQILAP